MTNGNLHERLAAAGTVHQAAAAVCDHFVASGMPMPSVYVHVAGRLRCVAQRGYRQVHDGVPPEVGILGATFRSGTPSIIPDVTASADFIAAGQGVVGELTFPFHHDGRVVGCVNLESPHPLDDAHVTLAASVTAALEEWVDRSGGIPPETAWQRLARESAALAQLRDHQGIARLAVARAPGLTPMTSALLVVEDGDGHRVTAAHGPLADVLRSLKPSTIDAILGWTQGGASVYTFGSASVSGFSGSEQIWDAGVQALASVPVMRGTRARGFLLAADGQPGHLTTEDVQVLELFATHVATALDGADAFAELRRQAALDTLTGLGHGAALHEHLGARMRTPEGGLAVLLIDLDDFKQVNDTHGHLFGDQVLRDLARAFEGQMGGTDRVYRLGGDEFAALITTGDDADAAAIAERLRAAAAATGHLTVSIGARRHQGERDSGTSPEQLLADADLALYEAKARGRDQVCVYRPAMRHAVLARARLAAELSAALHHGQLRLDYQPIIDLRSRRVLGAEALIRWAHPERGVVPPAEFITIAEEDGQIIDIGTWVVHRATEQVAAWRRSTGLPLTVSVNVSGTQLRPGFVATVEQALAHADLPADALTAEITESALVDETDRIEVLAALRRLGVRVAVDDFGTGYSSLSYLRRLPLDIVKIDRSFVCDLDDDRNAAVAKAIVDLTRTLGLSCIAEGVETADQAAHLTALDCSQAQGYLFSRPTSARQVVEMATAPGGAAEVPLITAGVRRG